ncbi:hypothetical protein N9129_03230, partial [Akkermansiaceae bacterium]|nr:hypothetical protein [Akkermansiaceae bacterium]
HPLRVPEGRQKFKTNYEILLQDKASADPSGRSLVGLAFPGFRSRVASPPRYFLTSLWDLETFEPNGKDLFYPLQIHKT